MKIAIYTRVSSDRQAEEGQSLGVQEARCRAWAAAQGDEVVEVYRDDGFSTKDTKRPAYQRMLSDLHAGRFDCIAVYMIDRLSRRRRDFEAFMAQCEEFGCAFVSVQQRIDTSTPMGRLLRGMLMDFAQFERELIAERVREVMGDMAKQGRHNGGATPFGYRRAGKGAIEPDPETAPIVREMFKLYDDGMSTDAILRHYRDRGRRLQKSQICRILGSRVYLGMVKWRGEYHQGAHEPLVEADVFERIQERLRANAKSTGPRDRTKRRYLYLLDGVVRCGLCGHHMTTSSGRGRSKVYFYYRCTDPLCTMKPMPAMELDQKVLETVANLPFDTDWLSSAELSDARHKHDVLARLAEELTTARREHTEAENRMHNIMDMAETGLVNADNKDEWNQALSKWGPIRRAAKERITALEAELEAERNRPDMDVKLGDVLTTLAERLKTADAAEVRPIIRTILHRVIVNTDSVDLEILPVVRRKVSNGCASSTSGEPLRYRLRVQRIRGRSVRLADQPRVT